jgi:hypothetical protein
MKEKDVKGVIKRQKRYATLAHNEGKYAQKMEKKEKGKHLKEMAKDSAREAKIAFMFEKKRKGFVKQEEKKLKGK